MKYKTPLQAIKKFCLECSGDSPKERRICGIKKCPLYLFRLGHKPKRQKNKIRGPSKKSNIKGS